MSPGPRKPAPGGSLPTAAGAGLRIAVSSPGAELRRRGALALTAVAVLAAGVTLYAARAAIGAALDRWLPRLERPAVDDLPSESAPAVPERGVGEAIEPAWTYVDVEAAIRPLPGRIEALIAEGRGETSELVALDPGDGERELLIRNRWRLWARVWRNRVDHVSRPVPPADACDVHAALAPTCRAVRESLALLSRVPAAGGAAEARELLDGAAAILERFRRSQAEAGEAGEVPP